jgi:hypothetical protein
MRAASTCHNEITPEKLPCTHEVDRECKSEMAYQSDGLKLAHWRCDVAYYGLFTLVDRLPFVKQHNLLYPNAGLMAPDHMRLRGAGCRLSSVAR